jgi:hypothetical protein
MCDLKMVLFSEVVQCEMDCVCVRATGNCLICALCVLFSVRVCVICRDQSCGGGGCRL